MSDIRDQNDIIWWSREELIAEVERLRAENAEFRMALDKFRIWMKNQDRSPYEQKIYDALHAALEGKP